MPIYEYQCPQCQHIFEEWLSVSAATDTSPCPQCTSSAVRIISNTAFVLKGGGWYVTEYGNRKQSNNDAPSKAPPTVDAAKSSTNTAAPITSTATPSTSSGAAAGA